MILPPLKSRSPAGWDSALGKAIVENTGALASGFRNSDKGAIVAKTACDGQWFPLPTHQEIAASSPGEVDEWLVSTGASKRCEKDLNTLATDVSKNKLTLADAQSALPEDVAARDAFAAITKFAKKYGTKTIGDGVSGLMGLCNRAWPAPGGRGPERLDPSAARKVLSGLGVKLAPPGRAAMFCHEGSSLDGAQSLTGVWTTTAGRRVDVELIIAAPKGGPVALAGLNGLTCKNGWLDNGHMVKAHNAASSGIGGRDQSLAFRTETFSGPLADPNQQGRIDEYIGERLGDIVVRLHVRPDTRKDGPAGQAKQVLEDFSSSLLDAIQTEAF